MAATTIMIMAMAFAPSALRPLTLPAKRPLAATHTMGLFGRGKAAPEPAATEAAAPEPAATEAAAPEPALALISAADTLHAAKKPVELFALLKDADTDDVEVAWRVARAYHDMAEEEPDKAAREQLVCDGLAVAEGALESVPDSGLALKWFAILLGRLGDFLPTKEKVANSYKIKDALVTAAELLPEDASVQTAIGQWCLKVAGISWVERNAAKLLFGSPPESSYEEALGFFEKSHAIRPSKKAALQAGQACDKLSRGTDAKGWYQIALDLPSAGAADEEIDKQAQAALR